MEKANIGMVASVILLRHFERLLRNVERCHGSIRKQMAERDGDASAAGADVEDAAFHSLEMRDDLFHQLFGFRPRNQYGRRDLQFHSAENGMSQNVLQRFHLMESIDHFMDSMKQCIGYFSIFAEQNLIRFQSAYFLQDDAYKRVDLSFGIDARE